MEKSKKSSVGKSSPIQNVSAVSFCQRAAHNTINSARHTHFVRREDDIAAIRQVAAGTKHLTLEIIIASEVMPIHRALAAAFFMILQGELASDVLKNWAERYMAVELERANAARTVRLRRLIRDSSRFRRA